MIVLGLASAVLAICGLFPGRLTSMAFVGIVMAYPSVLVAVCGDRLGFRGPLRFPLLVLGLVLEFSGFLVLFLHPRVGNFSRNPSLGVVIVIVGMWLVPLLLVGLAHALTFDRTMWTAADRRRYDEFSRKLRREDRR